MLTLKLFIMRILPTCDAILACVLYLPARLLKAIRARGIQNFPKSQRMLTRIGMLPIIDHFYDPLCHQKHLRKPLTEARLLPGIVWDAQEQIDFLERFHYSHELMDIKDYKEDDDTFHFNNGLFESGEVECWYNMIRIVKPRRIIEIGSGYSTLVAIRAIKKNTEDDPEYRCRHTCIEPYQAEWLDRLDITVIRKKVEEVEIERFMELTHNDILFIGSSHILRPQGDVLFEYLTLLPLLHQGVLIHIHDIFSPHDYPAAWVLREQRLWNEQYLLEAFLSSNSEWQIIMALNYLQHAFYDQLRAVCPFLTRQREPSSFYIQKIAPPGDVQIQQQEGIRQSAIRL